MKSVTLTATALIAALFVSGCANTAAGYRPIVDEAKSNRYETDLAACQKLATERSYINDDVKSEALLGSGLGTLIGAAQGGVDGAIAGAVVGSIVGGAGRAWETRDDRKKIVIQCMRQRNHKVVG